MQNPCGKHWACLFRLFAASGHQKLLRTAKRSAFQPASIKFVEAKIIQNQHKHIIGWVVIIVVIRHFLDPEPYEQLYLPPHIIVTILRFSPQPDSPHSQIFRKVGQKKAEPNRHIINITQIISKESVLNFVTTDKCVDNHTLI
jgi:hypothetical protein